MPLVGPTKTAQLPSPPSLRSLIGPSFILLGLGLGSGELILWPYLTARFGLTIIWGIIVGITLQFFLNMEIERYTLVKGESVFVGLARQWHVLSPIWFFISTLIPWIWPGIIATSGMIIAHVLGVANPVPITIGLLIALGILLSAGSSIYKTLETWQKWSITLGVPFIIIITLWIVQPADWQALAAGAAGLNGGGQLLPVGLPLLTFLGALAYSGAGGNLNLAQSFYIKDKGFGMGKHAGKINSLIRSSSGKPLTIEGYAFKPTKAALATFQDWWRLINLEHALVFWLTGLTMMLLLATLSYATVYTQRLASVPEGVEFLFIQAEQIGAQTAPIIGTLFLIVTAIMLFSTQTSIFDATSRIMAENVVILNRSMFKPASLGFFYYCFLWLQIIASIIVLQAGYTQPMKLLVVSAVLNAASMAIYSLLLLRLNTTALEPALRPNLLRRGALVLLSTLFISLAVLTLLTQ